MGFGFDFLMTLNYAWIIPQDQLMIPYRIFGSAPVDEIVCLALWSLLMLLVYEHFVEEKRREHVKMKRYFEVGIVPASLSLLFIIVAFFLDPKLIHFGYAYLIMGIFAILPVPYAIIRYSAMWIYSRSLSL